MQRPTRLLTLVAGATVALGALTAAPAAYAKPGPTGPQTEQTPGITLPPPHPCQVNPHLPACLPDLDITADPCIQYPEDECPFDDGGDDGDDGGDETTPTTQPEEPTDTPDPTVPQADDDSSSTMSTAAPATVVHASPTFTG